MFFQLSEWIRGKKADGMPWWLVMMAVAIVAMILILLIMGGSFKKFTASLSGYHNRIDRDSACSTLLPGMDSNNNGYPDTKAWDSDGDGQPDECCDPEATKTTTGTGVTCALK